MNKIYSVIIIRYSVRWSYVFGVVSFCFLFAGCETGMETVNPLTSSRRLVTMDLISNVSNTQFRFREQRLDANSEEGWQYIIYEPQVSGTEVTADLYEGVRYEIAAKPVGYYEKKVKFTEPIKRYEFKFVASDRSPVPTNPSLSTLPEQPRSGVTQLPIRAKIGKKWAVVVGISEYRQRGKWGLANLRYASRDATVLAKHLQKPNGGRFDDVRLLTDNNATVLNIKRALREQLRGVQKNDLVLVFWAGHGMPDPHEPERLYLVAHGSDPEHMASTAYAMDEFQRDIRNLRANNVIVLADACHSAGLSDPTQIVRNVRGKAVNNIVEGFRGVTIGPAPTDSSGLTTRLIFTSCEADEQSIESTVLGGGHGAFTYYLLEALKGTADREGNGDGDGRISLGEMIDYTTDKVKRFSQNRQHPDTAGRFDRDLVIGVAE